MRIKKLSLLVAAVLLVPAALGLFGVNALASNLIYDGAEDLVNVPLLQDTPFPGYEGEPGAGAGRFAMSDATPVYEEGKGLRITDRYQDWSGIDFLLGGLEPGLYTLEVGFACSSETTFTIEDADAPWQAKARATATEATVTYEFAITESGKAGGQNRWRLKATKGMDFFVVSVRLLSDDGEYIPPPPPEPDLSLPSLAEVYKDHFLMGNVISSWEMEIPGRLDLLKHHFNALTAENAMKPDGMARGDGTYNIDEANRLLKFTADNNFEMIGHTLAWHQQTPSWLHSNEDGSPLTRDEAAKNIDDFMKNTAGRLKGKILAWDVLNEAIEDGRSGAWEDTLRKSGWYNAFANGGNGADYVEYVFRAARGADPNAVLYYNDYNLDYPDKAQNVANMVKAINDKYLAEGNERLLIEGVGMQGHYTARTSVENVENSLKLFIGLGVEVSVTELDVTVPAGANKISEGFEKGQALKYAELFALYKKYSDHIARVTLWGIEDSTSWRSAQFPLLFNADFTPKEAFYAVVDPEKYLAENKHETAHVARSGAAAYGTPSMDAENLDPLWETAESLPIDIMLQAWQTASGTAKVLWDDYGLYVLFSVNDAVLDSSSELPHEEDSVEAFVDFTNCKSGALADCDGQYRVSFEAKHTAGDTTVTEGFESAHFVYDGGYRIIMKIRHLGEPLTGGAVIGFDAQINDAENGSRIGIAKWNDPSDTSHADNSGWGVLELLAPPAAPEPEPAPTPPPTPAPPPADDPDDGGNVVMWIFIGVGVALIIGASVYIILRKKKGKT